MLESLWEMSKPEIKFSNGLTFGNVKFSTPLKFHQLIILCSKNRICHYEYLSRPQPTGSYYCFLSSTNNIGWIQILGSVDKLDSQLLTWSN